MTAASTHTACKCRAYIAICYGCIFLGAAINFGYYPLIYTGSFQSIRYTFANPAPSRFTFGVLYIHAVTRCCDIITPFGGFTNCHPMPILTRQREHWLSILFEPSAVLTFVDSVGCEDGLDCFYSCHFLVSYAFIVTSHK